MNLSLELKRKLFIINRINKLVLKFIILDQLTKWWFIGALKEKVSMKIQIFSFLDMVYSWNHGISFGIFRDYHQYSNYVFVLINSIITLYLYKLAIQYNSKLSFWGYSLVIGGALGNIIDRFLRGAVFDFIYFHYKTYGFPIFNLADAFISIGAALLIYDHYKTKKSIEENLNKLYTSLEVEAEEIRKSSDKNIELGVK